MKLSQHKNASLLEDSKDLKHAKNVSLHSNIALLKGLDLKDITQMKKKFSKNVVWRLFNPMIPNIAGDYYGIEGIVKLFEKLDIITRGSFEYTPVKTIAVGNELVMMHIKNRMNTDTGQIEIDTVLVWRIIETKIVEVWNTPSVYDA